MEGDFLGQVFECWPWENQVIVSGSITKDGLFKRIVDPCVVCSLKVRANSVLCLQCGK